MGDHARLVVGCTPAPHPPAVNNGFKRFGMPLTTVRDRLDIVVGVQHDRGSTRRGREPGDDRRGPRGAVRPIGPQDLGVVRTSVGEQLGDPGRRGGQVGLIEGRVRNRRDADQFG